MDKKNHKGFFNIVIINVHVLIDEKEMDIKEVYYAVVEDQIDKMGSYYVKIILRDLNGNVGREEMYKNVISNHHLHEISNDMEDDWWWSLQQEEE